MPMWQRAQGKAVLLAPTAVANPRVTGERQIQLLSFNPITALNFALEIGFATDNIIETLSAVPVKEL